jgi:hypothetical protein
VPVQIQEQVTASLGADVEELQDRFASQSAVSWSVRFAARPGGSDLIAAEISFVSAEQAGGTTSDTWYSGQ